MLASGLVAGLGAGAIDAGINVHAAERFSPRLVSWLHASWGAGASLGPLIMTATLAAGLAWSWGYAVVAADPGRDVAQLLRHHRPVGPAAADGRRRAAPRDAATFLRTLRRPRMWAHMAVFFLYTGLEASAGQWAYSLLTEAREIPPLVAGTWVGGYWASLTAGRLVCGVAAHRFTARALLRASMVSALLAAALVWTDRGPASTLAGLALLGFSLAPIFPMLIASTPARLGAAHAAHAIGFQVSAACLGAAALPGAAGLIARWRGIEEIPTVLVANVVALLLVHEGTNAFALGPAAAALLLLRTGFRLLSNARTYAARAWTSAGVSFALKGSMAVPGTPSAMTADTLAGALPCFQTPSTKFKGSRGEFPSAMWQDWQWVLYTSATGGPSPARPPRSSPGTPPALGS